MKKWLKKHAVEIIVFAVAVVLTVPLLDLGWDEAKRSAADHGGPSHGEIVRNYGLIIAAIWAAVLAVWRSRIAERQVDEQRKAVEAQRKAVEAQRESTTQSDRRHRQSLSQTRLFQAVDLLKDEDETVRNAGARTLGRLVHDEDNPYREDALRMLEEFIRSHGSVGKTEAAKTRTGMEIDPLVQIAVRTVAEKELPDGLWFNLPKINLARADLTGADLTGADLTGAKLFGADLTRANLFGADLLYADLSGANFEGACLIDACLIGAHLVGAHIVGVNLTDTDLADADFDRAKGLTQKQLDAASQRPDGPPPKNLPDGLTWDEEAAKERWHEGRGVQPQC